MWVNLTGVVFHKDFHPRKAMRDDPDLGRDWTDDDIELYNEIHYNVGDR